MIYELSCQNTVGNKLQVVLNDNRAVENLEISFPQPYFTSVPRWCPQLRGAFLWFIVCEFIGHARADDTVPQVSTGIKQVAASANNKAIRADSMATAIKLCLS